MSQIATQGLYASDGSRKYINFSERHSLLQQIDFLPRDRALFVRFNALTGARVSEILQLVPNSFQLGPAIATVRTLKRRKPHFREIPLPKAFMAELDGHFAIGSKQRDPVARLERLWKFNRVTAWSFTKEACLRAGFGGVRASPRGLRHGFGRTTLDAGVTLDTLQRLLGHASIETTTIYTQACGADTRIQAERFWRYDGVDGPDLPPSRYPA
jgi:integrase/recombinase XerD